MEWSVVGRIAPASGRKGNATRQKRQAKPQRGEFSRTLAEANAARLASAGDGFARTPAQLRREAAESGLWRYVAQVNAFLAEWAAGRQMRML